MVKSADRTAMKLPPNLGALPSQKQHLFNAKASGGAALLIAMLIVAMVASLASAASWLQWRNAQAQADERAQAQSHWLARGALDWGKIVLNIDRRRTTIDDLTEPWAVPLAESRIGTFLSAEKNVSQNANTDLAQAFFSGGMVDLQSRLNFRNLISNGQIDKKVQKQFENLFQSLGLSASLANEVMRNYEESLRVSPTRDAPLSPMCVKQLVWLGLNNQQLNRIQNYVTILPEETPININTASEPVLRAALPTDDAGAAARLVAHRNSHPFKTLSEAQALLPEQAEKLSERYFSVSTEFFQLTGRLRLETLEVVDSFVLHRTFMQINTIAKAC